MWNSSLFTFGFKKLRYFQICLNLFNLWKLFLNPGFETSISLKLRKSFIANYVNKRFMNVDLLVTTAMATHTLGLVTWYTVTTMNHVSKCINYHKTCVVITERAHYFHDYTYHICYMNLCLPYFCDAFSV